MVKAIETLTIVFFISIIALLIFDVTDPFQLHAQRRNDLRREHLKTIMSYIESSIDPVTMTVPFTIMEPSQLGSSLDNCTIQNNVCTVLAPGCLDLQKIVPNPEYSIPTDISTGSLYKSGYMIQLEQPETIKLVACDAENGEEIVERKTITGLKTYVATPSATF